MNRRTQRLDSLIRATLGELLLSKISDPRIDPARTSITRVEIQEDLVAAKVYVSVMGGENLQRTTLRALQHAAGHLQDLLARRIKLRHTPVLQFVPDDRFKQTLKTYSLIQQAMEEIREKQDDSDGPDEDPSQDDSPQ
jgi:ribosome-binding factor A